MRKLFTKGLSLFLIFSVFLSFSAAPALAAVTYQYDTNGNMTSDGTDCYHYNEANQMDKVTNCGSGQTIAEYIYDYDGTRLVKKEYTNGVLSKTVYSPSDAYETVKQASNGATANTTYYQANGETIAKKNPDGTLTYYQNDHLGSTAVLSDQTGAVVEKTSYTPYGEVKSGGTQSKFGYTGQEQDNESGLDYYNARYYDPHIQRFTQPDSIIPDVYSPQQLNRYSYANNNPLRYTDPSGHFSFLIAAGIGALVGGVIGLVAGVIKTALTNPKANLSDYAKAGGAGFAIGAATGIASVVGGAFFEEASATVISRTVLSRVLSKSAQKTVNTYVGEVGGSEVGNSTKNKLTGVPLLDNALESGIIGIGSAGITTSLAKALAPVGRGRPTKGDWSLDLSPKKEVKELKNFGVQQVTGGIIDQIFEDNNSNSNKNNTINTNINDLNIDGVDLQ